MWILAKWEQSGFLTIVLFDQLSGTVTTDASTVWYAHTPSTTNILEKGTPVIPNKNSLLH